ncbi:Translation protein beta-barrel domain superfamily [Arabidopsis suecica]|uniref:Eukaryotic translation initiation factor 5B n=1 Tax=Arabidopsis suecica TaxID=45249 RepID=A0A8T2CBX5_ARASU|nr:Translation protein beta-barrel domain superfamily [Arabidopsis suecica]
MDPRNSSAWGGEDDLSLVSSMGDAESKNSCCVIDDGGSIGTKLCEKPKVEKTVAQPSADGAGDKDGEEKTVESFTAKKKKKKKDKGKKADASVANSSVEAKGDKQENSISEPKKKDVKVKVAEKKVPKHVREMQEIIARRKEAEERKKKEEEERLRKEEEERRIEEEREREAEEIRQKRKIRKMEKKQEGLILTAKQKREAAKNEAFRKRVLTDAGSLLVADKNGDSSKRPIYGNKNKSACKKANDSASVQMKGDVGTKENHAADEPGTLHDLVSVDDKRVGIIESEEAHESVDVSQENGNEEDVWDAKTNFTIKGDSDDEEEKTQHVFKNELNDTASKAHDSGHGADRPTVKPGVAGKPKTDAKQAIPKVDGATWPKDTSKKGEGLVLNEVAEEVEESLRSPICCIMGHVDSGKTKLLDCIRGTNVQEGEAGGITQQIGATYFPAGNIRERTKELNADAKLKVPGLLVIDTPGHEPFTNLRSRGSNLCDLAILVVDIMRGLEPQTLESLNLLRRRNVKFIVALNKVDRLYGWKKSKNAPLMKTMKQQLGYVVDEFNKRVEQVKTQFQEQGLNSMLNYENREMGETISIIPTSAISGEGIPDLLLLLVQWAQKTMVEKLTYVDKVQCTVLEVKVIEGHGITVDVVLVNGVLREGDQIVVCGSQGPIVTTIRSLLTPYPMNETRVKGTYMAHREVKAAQCIKIAAQGLEHAIAGTALHVIGPNEDMEEAKKNVMEDIESVMKRIDKSGEGVYVQASTLGSLEALLEFLKSSDVKVPVSGIGIGPVHKKDIMKAGIMLEKKEEFATILAFDVKITAEARELADKKGVKIFCDDTIYRLFNKFKSYIEGIKEEKKKETACEVVFPCVLQILPNHIYNKDPIILGVKVNDGILKVGTPICIFKRIENVRVIMNIGRVASIKNKNKEPVDNARKGQEVAIKIIASNPEKQKKFGKHFGIEDRLISHISRRSIDVLRTYYWEELSDDEKSLVLRLERKFNIQ